MPRSEWDSECILTETDRPRVSLVHEALSTQVREGRLCHI